MKDIKLVVAFIPALNEERKIGTVIEAIKRLYKGSESRGFRLKTLVVNDGSTDSTVKVAKEAGADKIISHHCNLGLGAATRTGMQAAYDIGADIALKFDADFQHDPEDIEKVIQPILKDEADIVYGSRFAGKINYKMPIVRYIGNKVFTWLMRKMTGWKISDAQTGLMVYSRKYLAIFNMPGDYNPPQQTLVDAYHKHMRYAEVPVVFHPRTTGKSFVSLRYPFEAMLQILRVLILTAPLKIFVPVGLIFIFLGLLVGFIEIILLGLGRITYIHNTTIIIFIIFGFQALCFGILADLIIDVNSRRRG